MIPEVHGLSDLTGEQVPVTGLSFSEERNTALRPFVEVLCERLGERIPVTFMEDAAAYPVYIRLKESRIDRDDPACGAYRIRITPESASVFCSHEEGLSHALTTIYHLLTENEAVLPCGEISDAPAYGFRSFMLDCSRHFFSLADVRTMIEEGAKRKLNRMHWHLSDDQGYRIESRRFPELNRISSWRTEADGSTYGGFYTMQEIRETVAYARVRGVEIMPELDMPGHFLSILAAYPEFSCDGGATEISGQGGISDRILCAGNDDAMQFVYALLEEITALFPYAYFHIGGDEAPKGAWERCPKCQKRIRDELKLRPESRADARFCRTPEEELQAWFTGKVSEKLESLGKKAIGWNEILRSGTVSEQTAVQYWAENDVTNPYCEEAFEHGRKCVYSFCDRLYLDYGPQFHPMRMVYETEFLLKSGKRIPDQALLGIECPLWAEFIETPERLQEMAFPRLFAMAAIGWEGSARPSYEVFQEACETELRLLDRDGIRHFSMEDADVTGERQLQWVMDSCRPHILRVYEKAPERIPGIKGYTREILERVMTAEELESAMQKLFETP